MRAAFFASLPLLLLLALAPSLCTCTRGAELGAALVVPPHGGDAVAVWRSAASAAAQAVVQAAQAASAKEGGRLSVTDVPVDSLRIWQGQRVSLGLEVDGTMYSFLTQPEPEWHSLAESLPATEGGLLPAGSWDALERHWVTPVTSGPTLKDVTLVGPLELLLPQPTPLQLYLPHATDVGAVRRVLLREGAAVVVRGARAITLRRPVDLPPIGLSQFADIVTSDAQQQRAEGLVQLLSGVRAAAERAWNASGADQSPALVALQLELAPQGAALLAAPTPAGGLQRLRARRLKEGVVELTPRDAALLPPADARALALGAEAPYAWPLQGLHPQHLQAYERLLREVLASALFKPQAPAGGVRVAQDLPLRLQETAAEAVTLVEMQLELERTPVVPGSSSDSSSDAGGDSAGAQQQRQGQRAAAAGGKQGAGAGGEAAGMLLLPPRSAEEVLAAPRRGFLEAWTAVLEVRGNAALGTLRLVPVQLRRTDASEDTVTFGETAMHGFALNFTAPPEGPAVSALA